MIFLLLGFTVLAFFLMFHVDLHRAVQRKTQAQNAGDAAALATARWQGATLNLVGELNLLHVLALAALPEPDHAAVDAITNMQARLCFTGPLAALYAAQVAAKNNHIYADRALTALCNGYAADFRQYASVFNDNGDLSSAERLREYADILELICAEGIAAGPDNYPSLNLNGRHILFDKAFYEAVAGASWCWFFLYHNGLLESYHSFRDWPPFPETDALNPSIRVFFDIGVHPEETYMRWHFTKQELEHQVDYAGLSGEAFGKDLGSTSVMDVAQTWYRYNRGDWTAWEAIKPEMEFPAAGEVRPEYDYAGADAVVRVSAAVDRIMPDAGRQTAMVNWTAAAKPFGHLSIEGTKTRPDSAAAFVLPAFRDARLIPADTASNPDASSSDIEWVTHLKAHMKPYMASGETHPGCTYCNALGKWEVQAFRQSGIEWLKVNSSKCRIPAGGGGRRGGGSSRGH